MLPTRVRDKINMHLCEEPYLRRVSVICVCSKNPTKDDICKRGCVKKYSADVCSKNPTTDDVCKCVCVKKHSADACTIHVSVVRILLQTMFVNASR